MSDAGPNRQLKGKKEKGEMILGKGELLAGSYVDCHVGLAFPLTFLFSLFSFLIMDISSLIGDAIPL